jgi:drug/metabolite transporter (DMT)-like permease
LIQARIGRRLLADLSLLGVAAVWGLTFVMVKEALEAAGPLTFLALRFTLATLLLAPLWLARRAAGGRAVAAGLLVGLCLFAGYALQTAGLQFTSASKAGFITGLSVVAVPAIGAAVARRWPAPALLVGVGLAASGLGLLSLREAAAVQLGDLLVLGCALAFALHILVLGHLAPRFDVLSLTTWQIVAAAALTAVGAGLFERPSAEQLGAILPAAAFTGLFATVAAFYLQTQAQRFTTPTHTALIFSTEPVFAGLFGYLLAGERLDGRALLGCGLILAGMLVAQLAPDSAAPVHEPFG